MIGYRRIIIEENTFCINDLRLDLTAVCGQCGFEDYPAENFILQVEKQSRRETFCCLRCWREKPAVESWVGIFCLIFFTEKGFGCSSEMMSILNEIFGSPMDALRPVGGGFVLYSNSVKCEQLKLF